MGENLFIEWIEDEVEDIQAALTFWGVSGLLERFEEWLKIHGKIIDNALRIMEFEDMGYDQKEQKHISIYELSDGRKIRTEFSGENATRRYNYENKILKGAGVSIYEIERFLSRQHIRYQFDKR